MKGLHKIALCFAVGLLVVSGLALAGEGAWFDMEHCSFCKNLLTDPELLDHMTWEQVGISKGIISITTVEEEYADSFAKASAAMEAAGKAAEQGKQMPMCNSCMAFGQLMMKGLNSEQLKTKHGEIWIVTSNDPEVVEELHKWAKKNMTELAKWETSEG